MDWYNWRGTVTDANGRRSKGTEKPREEWIAVPVPDAGIPAEVVTIAGIITVDLDRLHGR